MKIALIGYGKMGKTIDKIASDYALEITVRLDVDSTSKDWDQISNVDVCIDFSHPDVVLNNIEKVASYQKPIVIGTTGWYDQIDFVKEIANQKDIGVIYAQNFSIGMNLFLKMVSNAAHLIDCFNQYDIAISEIHHTEKADSPSGTAYAISESLLNNMTRKNKIRTNLNGEKLRNEELLISSSRVGKVCGIHTVTIDSKEDTITITHTAHDRAMWAHGALRAAEWIQKRKGFFNITDMLEVEYATP